MALQTASLLPSAPAPAFSRSSPCLFQAAVPPSTLALYKTLSSLTTLIPPTCTNTVRRHSPGTSNVIGNDYMTFERFLETIPTGEARRHDLYWAFSSIPDANTGAANTNTGAANTNTAGQEPLHAFFSSTETLLNLPPASMTAWVGTSHTEPLHYDNSDNLHLMVQGQKRWLLFPPNSSLDYPSIVAAEPKSDQPYTPDPFTSPKSLDSLTPAIDVTLNPGDLLYIPAGWSHSVISQDETPFNFSVNKFYDTSLLKCLMHGSFWMVARNRLYRYKKAREGWAN